ncbi:protein 5NUC [Drosophila bipectinata]|uniref:protein 5NUC n=1 Tax=Drosophila bipectinata TaxID=42026 RepID=UPI001C8AD18A|nr:protein 5NUC [Drosophila bipectinata]
MLPPLLRWIIVLLFLRWIHGVKFMLMHTNDMHAWFDPISAKGGKCQPVDDEQGQCFGGFGRVATALEKARNSGPTIYLNAGDTFQGTPWFSVYGGKMVAELLNMLAPDAMALGVHEFDDGVPKLIEFLELVNFPVVSGTLNLTHEPKLAACAKLMEYKILNLNETLIGVVGYIRSDTKQRTQPNNVIYKREISSINKITKILIQNNVNIIIALGHSGYQADMDIAMHCPDVDIVVGGQSHTFLYSGRVPDKDVSEGPYPTIVIKPDGRKVLVLQAYAYTKYLGKINLEFDSGGNLIYFNGNPILLDNTFQPRQDIQEYLEKYRQVIKDMENHVVGTTTVFLNGDRKSCGLGECNFGNIIADSFVYARVLETMSDRSSWTDASIGIINAGAIRASIEPGETGAITEADVVMVLPLSQELFYTRISGAQLMRAFEHSAYLRSTDNTGGFLQVSGLRLKFNYSHPKGQRITEIKALCSSCQIPHYENVIPENYYGVVLTSFLLHGGEGYNFIDSRKPTVQNLSILDRMAVIRYLQEHKVIYPEREGRIMMQERVYHSSSGRRGLVSAILFATFLYLASKL